MPLCGSDVFLIGHRDTAERIMIDAGDTDQDNEVFLRNLNAYFEDVQEERRL